MHTCQRLATRRILPRKLAETRWFQHTPLTPGRSGRRVERQFVVDMRQTQQPGNFTGEILDPIRAGSAFLGFKQQPPPPGTGEPEFALGAQGLQGFSAVGVDAFDGKHRSRFACGGEWSLARARSL